VNSELITLYDVYGSGDVIITNTLTPQTTDLPEIPRLGMYFSIPDTFDTVTWYGRGPHENYWDRKTGAHVGTYSMPTAELFTPYIRPQENGNRDDVRWVVFSDSSGVGLMACELSRMAFSASLYEDSQIEAAGHPYELMPREQFFVHLDHLQMGVGGDNSWGARPHPQYTISAASYEWRVRIRPWKEGETIESEQARLGF
jgi:beta-galactosidase